MRWLKIFLIATITLSQTLLAEEKTNSSLGNNLPDGLYARFVTSHGVIVAELFTEKAPMTVANFVGLAEGTLGPKKGQPYYRDLNWYRVVPGFVIQSGNPNHPAEGDAGYTFPDEFSPGLHHDAAGILSMANGGPDTNSAEFFITLGDQTRLNYLHSVFGRVVDGLELLPQIKQGDAFSVGILRIGPVAKTFKSDEISFKALVARARPYKGEMEPGTTAHFDDPDNLLPTNPPRAQTFNYKLNNFQRATGEKIVARVFLQSPPPAEDSKPGAYMHALAEKLGTAQRGVLAAYFAADDDWRIWIGEESTSAFLDRRALPEDLVEDGPLHKKKEVFLDVVRATADTAFKALKAVPPDELPGQRLKFQTDAMLDGLIGKLESSANRETSKN